MYVSDVVLCLTLSDKLKIHIIRAYIVPLHRPHCSNTLTAMVYTSQRTVNHILHTVAPMYVRTMCNVLEE